MAKSDTRAHVHEECFQVTPERLFALLHTPSAIRHWWSATRAIVMPREGGLWTATWGSDEDAPDYVSSATLRVFDPPRRLVMADQRYHSRFGGLGFEADFTTEFTVRPDPAGAILRVEQSGFPKGPQADDFYAACERGWRDTFAGIRRFLESRTLGSE